MSIFWNIQPKYKRYIFKTYNRYFYNTSKILYGQYYAIPSGNFDTYISKYRFDKYYDLTEKFGLRGEKACKLYWQSHRK